MAKRVMSVALAFIMIMIFVGCGSGVSQKEYDVICSERDELKAKLAEMQAAEQDEVSDTVTVSIEGTFTASVRHIIPDYCFDDVTPSVAVVTLFQDGPFTIFVGELASQLEVGEIYVFEIQSVDNIEITKTEYQKKFLSIKELVPQYNLRIKSARLAKESDYGLDAEHLFYKIQEEEE